jgi:hypothetical protein
MIKPMVAVSEEIRRAVLASCAVAPRRPAPALGHHTVGDSPILNDGSSPSRVRRVDSDLRIYARADDDDTLEGVDAAASSSSSRASSGATGVSVTSSGLRGRLASRTSRIVQVLTNILVNAVQAIEEIERPIHRVRITARADGEFVAISISDSGPGIPEDALDRIFDPFFTTKDTGKGTGLGLSISQSILRKLGGDLIAESVHGEGATFIALLPVPDEVAIQKAELAAKKASNGVAHTSARPTVLVVEDATKAATCVPRALHDYWCVVFVASDGQRPSTFSRRGLRGLMTDLAMPEVDGQELFEWLVDHRPASHEGNLRDSRCTQ